MGGGGGAESTPSPTLPDSEKLGLIRVKYLNSHILETLIFELFVKRAFRKYIVLPLSLFVVSELQLIEVEFVAKR